VPASPVPHIDVRGAARDVVRGIGIEEDIRAANTTEVGMRFVRHDGSTAASFPMGTSGTDGPTAELPHASARILASPAVRTGISLAGRTFGSIPAEKIALPNYSLNPV
jgi:hypothetical protein